MYMRFQKLITISVQSKEHLSSGSLHDQEHDQDQEDQEDQGDQDESKRKGVVDSSSERSRCTD